MRDNLKMYSLDKLRMRDLMIQISSTLDSYSKYRPDLRKYKNRKNLWKKSVLLGPQPGQSNSYVGL